MRLQRQRVRRAPTGHRIGEGHHRARLLDSDVSLLRELHERHGLGYGLLARKFGVPRSTVQGICTYRRRVA